MRRQRLLMQESNPHYLKSNKESSHSLASHESAPPAATTSGEPVEPASSSTGVAKKKGEFFLVFLIALIRYIIDSRFKKD